MSQRKSLQPSLCSCWDWEEPPSAAQDATKESKRNWLRLLQHLIYGRQPLDAHLLREGLQLLLGVNVLPDPLHVVPVLHDPVLHRVAHRQQASVLLKGRDKDENMNDFILLWELRHKMFQSHSSLYWKKSPHKKKEKKARQKTPSHDIFAHIATRLLSWREFKFEEF